MYLCEEEILQKYCKIKRLFLTFIHLSLCFENHVSLVF